ncbi:GNAT family N-acetyltransferase [Virgibacillus sp. NKC19-16]|uniref:GNAT family N-acetyltransferase n=1 Tax=Virgibacillus salidurans TaxID=2831673 RepID=UPI001F48F978|nr:GNAT family protein [Virgibacillus sp. NKC19-16]UJL46364.1 GNAT family N-acetyltransferase [Virgibacillus sp. NKC19-16]
MGLVEVDEELYLRLFEIGDAEDLFRMIDDSRDYLREWLSWVDNTKTVDDSRGFIEHTLRTYEAESEFTAGIFYQGKLVGTAGFNSFDWTNKVGYIGYWLAEGYQGKGIMSSVCRALISFAFYELQLNKVAIRAACENKKSRAIPERLGFAKEGEIRQAEWLYDHYVDYVVYGMLAHEWERSRFVKGGN